MVTAAMEVLIVFRGVLAKKITTRKSFYSMKLLASSF